MMQKPEIKMRKCSQCQISKPETLEFFSTRGKGKFKSWCRHCVSKIQKAKYAENPAYYLKKSKDSQAKNREYYRLKSLENYYANPARYRENTRQWRARNREAVRIEARKYYRLNRDRYVAHSRNYQLKKREAGSYSAEDVKLLLAKQDGCCAYCGNPLGHYEVEHVIPISRGGANTAANLALACTPCNRQKSSKTPEEWVDRWYLTPS